MSIIPNFIRKKIIPNEIVLIDKVMNIFSRKNQIMLDVGCCKGEAFIPFVNKKWMIHAFEPNKKNFEYLKKKWKNKKVKINRLAVSNQNKKNSIFFSSSKSEGIGSLINFSNEHDSSEVVDVITLKSYCENEKIEKVDFLKIDAEGYDKFVLEGIDWDRISPCVIMCEFEDRKTKKLNYTKKNIIQFLIEKEYNIMISIWHPIQKYGGAHKWRSFEYRDFTKISDNSWGNIIAIKDDQSFQKLKKVSKLYKLFWSFNIYYYVRKLL